MIDRKLPLLSAAAFLAVALYSGWQGYQILETKAVAQKAVTDSVERWKASYRALQTTVKFWDAAFRPQDTVQDVLSLVGLVRLDQYGMQVDSDAIALTKVEAALAANGSPLGLARICLASLDAGGAGLTVRAPSYAALFQGLDQVAARPDLEIGNIHVQGDKPVPTAILGDFCVLLRNS